ncbi:MAG TPA: sugar ABC transporter ATP-binding protein, partial [Terriglobales bacterium]|nr:sugar ABC transporter ATP-binding protein [Terriglobales bacterium]
SLLEIKSIWKYYGANPALRDVSATIRAGEILAFMGHNGAGKSTLVKILAGSARQDAGDIFVNGQTLHGGVRSSRAAGIAVIYQDLSLFPKLTVAENIVSESFDSWKYSSRRAKQRAAETLHHLEADSPLRSCLDVCVQDLSLAMQQRVAIARALTHDSRVLILDEPTASLSMQDTDHLLEYLQKLAARGVGIVLVSHRLSDVRRVADRYLVLRDGAVTLSAKSDELAGNALAQAMFGEHTDVETSAGKNVRDLKGTSAEIFTAQNATRQSEFSNINLTLCSGEITVLTGLTGSGRTEFAESLVGLRSLDSGTLTLLGKSFRPSSSRDALQRGVAYVPEDRLRSGLFAKRSVAENLSGATQHLRSRLGFTSSVTEIGKQWISDFGVICSGPNAFIETLSGGNQQKVLLARWSMAKPRVWIRDEPTAGVDVRAKAEIHSRLRQWADAGAALLVISSETDEVLDLADRILVFHGGTVALNSPRNQVTREQLMTSMLHGKGSRTPAEAKL